MANEPNKKIIVCCDGTWQNADSGYTKPTLIPYHPYGVLQTPSNVVRLSRALKRHDTGGKPQIVYYQSGVGSGATAADKLTGGLLGTGISENIREAYAFITTNWIPGDEIILLGFSRGAFTARSIAGLINDLGLLTREGMECFFAIFKDNENANADEYKDIFPDIPFPNKPVGKDREKIYKRRLLEAGMTRVNGLDGKPIEIQAVAVWDTVGSLGIPSIGWLQKLGFPHSTKELKFHDTYLSNVVQHAFQALALDEHRGPFTPAVWERGSEVASTTDLRQVWFPGCHSNVGGGYPDQEIANVTLAWMMDQLASIGVEFQDESIDRVYNENRKYYETEKPKPGGLLSIFSTAPTQQWASRDIYEQHKPVRPWGLGEIYESETGIWLAAGKKTRTPGLYMRADPDSGNPTNVPLQYTNERIHSSVRIRLDLGGLDLDDKGLYKCPSLLTKGPWELRKVRIKVYDPIGPDANWGGLSPGPDARDGRWVWEYVGPRDTEPLVRTMIEENLGPYERRLLMLSTENRRRPRRKRRRRKSREI